MMRLGEGQSIVNFTKVAREEEEEDIPEEALDSILNLNTEDSAPAVDADTDGE